MQRRWLAHVALVLAYGLVALALTWPLAAHLGSHVPGNGVDDPPLTWNLWWVPSALLDLGRNPFHCDYLFYPLGINLSFYTLTVLNALLSIPLQAVAGLVASSNLLLLSSFVLGAYGTFLLARAVHKSPSLLPPVAAGLIYAFSSSKLFYAALGQWNIASSQWIPFYGLYLIKMGREPRRLRYPLLAALFLLFQAYAELTYASFLVLFTGLWLAWHLLAPEQPGQRARLVLNLSLVALLVAAGSGPLLAAMAPDLLAEGDIWGKGGGFADVFSADLLGFVVPTSLHPLWGGLAGRFSFHQGVGQHIYPGYAVLGLALLGAVACWRRPAVRFWTLSAACFWLLTLGPSLHVNGRDVGLPLPFALLVQLPFFKGNRYPSRYSVLLVLSLALLAAFGLSWLWTRLMRRRAPSHSGARHPATASLVLLATCPLLLLDHLSLPLPLSDMAVPPVYRQVAALPGDFTLLDLPVAWRNGARVTGTQDPIIMFEQYYQVIHGKRLLAGNTSRNPAAKFQYFVEAPVISSLVALETGHELPPAVLEADRGLAPQVLRFLDVQAIVVHPAQAGPAMVPYLEAILPLEPLFDDGTTLAYRVDLPPWPAEWTVRPGEPLARLSLAEGWSPPLQTALWAQRRNARLLLPLAGREARLSLRVLAPGPGQRLRVEAAGWASRWLPLPEGWSDQELRLPALPGQPLAEIWLHFDRLFPAGKVPRLAPRLVGATGVESPVNLVVYSAGQEVGNLGQIYVNGRDVSPGARGYNVAVIHPDSGAVEAIATFDTHLDEKASQHLATFLATVPAGRIVAVAAADEASRLLGEDAVEALGRLGAGGDLRGRFRWGHALIGVQGAAPGTAVEAMDWLQPVAVAVGEAATEPNLAAAFEAITFTTVPTR